jgi:hypothetical protein
MNYIIEVSDTRKHKNQGISLHLITGFGLIGLGAFTFLMGNSDWVKTIFHDTIISNIVLAIICLGYGFITLFFTFFKGYWLKKNNQIRIGHFAIASLLCLLFLASQWWLAAAISGLIALSNLYAFFIQKKMLEPLIVSITEDCIHLPYTSRRKQLSWPEVERLIINHGNITIDSVDNFLFQWPLKNKEENAAEIEAFCTAKILSNIKNRQSRDW